jgi:hypothetical protein
MSKIKATYFRWFWVWQEEKETLWLKNMSKKGWHLKSVKLFVYTFLRGEPIDANYYLDLNYTKKNEWSDYIEIFNDLGWKLICSNGVWHYFSSPSDNKIREVYTNNRSKLKKYRTILYIHILFLPQFVLFQKALAQRMEIRHSFLENLLMICLISIFLVLLYSTFNMIAYVSKLNNDLRE